MYPEVEVFVDEVPYLFSSWCSVKHPHHHPSLLLYCYFFSLCGTMRYITLFHLPLFAAALSNVAPGTFQRSLKNIVEKDVFDPTAGENAPLAYNNKNEVWVPQVYLCCLTLIICIWRTLFSF